MNIKELLEAVSNWVYIKPGQLRGSWSPERLKQLGFRLTSGGAWTISRKRWEQLVRNQQIY